MSSNEPPRKRQRQQQQQQPLIPPINTGTILSEANLNDGHRLIGKPPASRDANPELYDGLVAISTFLRQHQYLSSSSSSENSNGPTDNNLAKIYGPTIENFTESQFERQSVGLRTNINGASAADLKKVVDCHADALRHGLDSMGTQQQQQETHWFDNIETSVCDVHSKLCPDIPQSGKYRENKVRAARTGFTLPENIKDQMEKLALAMKQFETKWGSSSTAIVDEKQWIVQVYQKTALSAILLFGVNDIHPFKDGNGRVGRIFGNIALKRLLGLPFPVVITATAQQRREYVDALKEGRTRLERFSTQQSSSGVSTNDDPPVFEKLITVVFERVVHAVRQVNSVLAEKTQAAATEEEARIARRVRERSAEGQCVICKCFLGFFDEIVTWISPMSYH